MKIITKDILGILKKMLVVVDTSGTHWEHPSQNFHFGENVLQTHTATMRATTPVPFSLNCSVEAKPFYNLLRTVTEDEVDIELVGDKLHVTAGLVHAKINTHKKRVIKEFSFHDTSTGKTVCSYENVDGISNIIEGMKYFKYAVLKNGAGPRGGLYIDEDVIMSTDRRRIMIWLLDEQVKKLKCILSAKLVEILQVYKGKVSRIDLTSTHVIKVQLDDSTYLEANTIAGNYPDLLQYTPQSDAKNVIHVEFDKTFEEALSRHALFLRMVPVNDKEVTLSIHGDICTMTSKTSSTGELTEQVVLKSSVARDVTVVFHPAFLQDVVSVGEGFDYHIEDHVAVVNIGKLQYMLQVRQ